MKQIPNIINLSKNFLTLLKSMPKLLFKTATFLLLLVIILISKLFSKFASLKLIPGSLSHFFEGLSAKIYMLGTRIFDRNGPQQISRSTLIDMSLKSMHVKKTRTIVTIGGMTIGIASIVFLVSLGYGLQELVVNRVARLEELSQADITPQPGGKVKINDKTIADLKSLTNVDKVLPMISVVGKVNYNSSNTSMAVYGVTRDFLVESAVKPSAGKIFASNNTSEKLHSQLPQPTGQVAGVFTQKNPKSIEFLIEPDLWVKVRSNPSANSQILGYTKHQGGKIPADEITGGTFQTNEGNHDNRWLKTSVPLWELKNNAYVEQKDEAGQKFSDGYIAEVNVQVFRNSIPLLDQKVLGISTESGSLDDEEEDVVEASNSAYSKFVDIASESAAIVETKTKRIPLGKKSEKVAVVNQAALKVLGISTSKAVGKKFNVTFTVLGNLLENSNEKVESNETPYTIIGVVPDDKTPFFYVPFMDLKSLGIDNYSQLKLIVNNKNTLPTVRKQTEALGLRTKSVSDTVSQINTLFGTVRTIMAVMGLIALSVAALGMFNTLTVSLLERTREVGLMKAMGMKSAEVKELFLTESIVMSLGGGFFGILLGILLGKLLGLVLSIFTISKGLGFIDISYVPPMLALAVIALSLVVGIVTGYYPSRRATKISALDALRYE